MRIGWLAFFGIAACGGEAADLPSPDVGADATTDGADSRAKAGSDVGVDTTVDSTVDTAPLCECLGVAASSAYRKGKVTSYGSSVEGYLVSDIVIGPKAGVGTYTLYAPKNEPMPPYIHTAELRDATGAKLAGHDYHWGDDVTYERGYTFAFGDYMSITLMCPGGCSQSLYDVPSIFDGKRPLVIECAACP